MKAIPQPTTWTVRLFHDDNAVHLRGIASAELRKYRQPRPEKVPA